MSSKKSILYFLAFALLFSCQRSAKIKLRGELRTWHNITLEINGPQVSESDVVNPFLDYKLEAVFTNGDEKFTVPGYFAADGNAGETGASSGSIWKIHFSPNRTGSWSYELSFHKGKNIAISSNSQNVEALELNEYKGSFIVKESDKTGNDFRAKGRLENTDSHYLRHQGTGEIFLKAGADSPENFLGYSEFDGTYYGGNNQQRSGEDSPNSGLHAYEPHIQDWKEGDPEWQGGKGKGIIGALNYLSSKGMNSVYFLTMNILGDGEDVWPYTDRNERYRFDCSKLDQWEIVFSHMDYLGIMMHVVLQETENEQVLDGGYLDVQRKLYIRELAARFSHHNAITWNLGEEHGPVEWMPYGQSVDDTKKMADFIREIDPYDHFIVMHTHPNSKNRQEYLPSYLGHESIDGPSIQAGNPFESHITTLKWLQESKRNGKSWVVCIDEIGQHWKGAMPDITDPSHDTIRKQVLWGNLMAGGAGVEWYFGYKYPHGDLNCEDWRSRENLWEQSRHAISFFKNYLPVLEMKNMDELVENAFCYAKPNEIYAVYTLGEGFTMLDLSDADGAFKVRWYNPRLGGDLMEGTISEVWASKNVKLGYPPDNDDTKDWVCLLNK